MNSSDVGSGADPSQLAGLRELLETGKPVRIRKAIGELILIRDDGSALALAARYIGAAGLSAEALIRLWPKVADPDGFCAALLAPTLVRENRTSVRLRRLTSLTGLRHLTMLRELSIERCKEITDLTEAGTLTGLTDLDLNGCSGIEDLPAGLVTELQIDGVDWRDLSRPAGHKKLRVLWLDMDKLEDVSALLGMPDLIGVHVGSCGSLDDLHPLPDLPLKEATYPSSLRSGRPVPRRPWSPVPSPPLARAPRTNPSPKWSDALKLG